MSERLWTATLTAEQLERWLVPPRTTAKFTILERLTAIAFPAPTEPIPVSEWTQGRIFGSDFELRWEKRGDHYRAWLAGEQAPEDFWTEVLLPADMQIDKKVGCYLWGPNEMRIAHHLDYRALPEGKGRPWLIRHDFRDKEGTLVYFRFAGMQRKDKS